MEPLHFVALGALGIVGVAALRMWITSDPGSAPGRWLCRLGLHSRGDLVDYDDEALYFTCWRCGEPMRQAHWRVI